MPFSIFEQDLEKGFYLWPHWARKRYREGIEIPENVTRECYFRALEIEQEAKKEGLVVCPWCGRQWDGNAQCPCSF